MPQELERQPQAVERQRETVTDGQQLRFLSRDVFPLFRAAIHVRMTLGDYRRASHLKFEVGKVIEK